MCEATGEVDYRKMKLPENLETLCVSQEMCLMQSKGSTHTCMVWLPYRPPSRNEVDSGSLKRRMQIKREALEAWSSALSDSDIACSIATISRELAKFCATKSPTL